MPRIVLWIALATAALAPALQSTGSQSAEQPKTAKKRHFLIRITPARAGFVEHPTTAEQKAMGEHVAYLRHQASEGKVVLAGPSINGEKTFGIIVVEVGSEEEAGGLIKNDPSVKAGVMKFEILPFSLAILRGR
jgi:uncharacterized protein YciI